MRDKDVMMDDWGKDVQMLSQHLRRRQLRRERETFVAAESIL